MKQARLVVPAQKTTLESSLTIVNIVLLLIFFFLATGSMVGSQDYYVELPETAELPLDILPKPLLIIDENREMLLDGEPVEPGTLNAKMSDYAVLHILADHDHNAIAMLDVLAAENLIAVEIKLVTLHRKQETDIAESLP